MIHIFKLNKQIPGRISGLFDHRKVNPHLQKSSSSGNTTESCVRTEVSFEFSQRNIWFYELQSLVLATEVSVL